MADIADQASVMERATAARQATVRVYVNIIVVVVQVGNFGQNILLLINTSDQKKPYFKKVVPDRPVCFGYFWNFFVWFAKCCASIRVCQ